MIRLARMLTLFVITMTGSAFASLAADENATVPVASDLTAVIALRGLPCGKVVSASQRGEDDYVASCADGNRDRVFVNADGRVVVEKVD